MVSTGGLVPQGTVFYPVKIDTRDNTPLANNASPERDEHGNASLVLYLFKDEFGEWRANIKGTSAIY